MLSDLHVRTLYLLCVAGRGKPGCTSYPASLPGPSNHCPASPHPTHKPWCHLATCLPEDSAQATEVCCRNELCPHDCHLNYPTVLLTFLCRLGFLISTITISYFPSFPGSPTNPRAPTALACHHLLSLPNSCPPTSAIHASTADHIWVFGVFVSSSS